RLRPVLRPGFGRSIATQMIIPMSECCVYATSSGCMDATISLFLIKSIHLVVDAYPHCGCGEIRHLAGHDRASPSQAGRAGRGPELLGGTAESGRGCAKKMCALPGAQKKSPAGGGASNQLDSRGIYISN